MRDFSILKQRILQFLENKGITKYKFYQETGITNGILSQKNGLTEENIERFLSTYPEVSAEWLMRGEGSMFVSKSVSSEEKCKQSKDMKTEIEEGITQISGLQEKADEFFSRIEQMEKDAKKRDFILERMAATLDGIRQDLSKLHSDENDFSHCG